MFSNLLSFLSNNKKLLLTYFSILILIPISFLLITQLKKPVIKSQPKPTTTETTTVTPSVENSHPSLFYADLEYDPKNNSVTQRAFGKINGDIPYLSPDPPPASSEKLIYKIEVLSDKNELLQTGWSSISKKLISTSKNTLRFRVTTVYQPKAILRVSLPNNKIIWTGKIL